MKLPSNATLKERIRYAYISGDTAVISILNDVVARDDVIRAREIILSILDEDDLFKETINKLDNAYQILTDAL